VGHNPHAARALAAALASDPRPTVAVVGMLADKDPGAFLAPLLPHLQSLHLAALDDLPRGASTAHLRERCPTVPCPVHLHASVDGALAAAAAHVPASGRLLVTGSFHTVERALRWREVRLERAG